MRAPLRTLVVRAALAFAVLLSPLARVTTVASVAEDYGGNSLDTPEEQHIYHVNHCFNIGNRDGYRDRKKKKVRSPEKSCTDVEGKQALDAGYQQGLLGQRTYRRDHRLSNWARPRVGP